MCQEVKIFLSLALVYGPLCARPSSAMRFCAKAISWKRWLATLGPSAEVDLIFTSHLLLQIRCSANFRHIRQHKKARDRYRQRDDAVNDEQPLSPGEPAFAPEMIHSSHEIAGYHGGNGTTRVEDTRPFGELVFSVPRPNHILHTRIEGALRETD